MPHERRYFKLTGGLVDMSEKHSRLCKRVMRARRVFMKEWKATHLYANDRDVYGLIIPGDPPEGWRKDRKEPRVCVPDRKTADGRKLTKQLEAFRIPLPQKVYSAIGAADMYPGERASGTGFAVHFTQLEKIGGDWYLSVGAAYEPKHPSLIEIKHWEWVKLIDEENARRERNR